MNQVLYLKKLLHKVKNISIDGFIDLLYFYTTMSLIFFAVLVGVINYIDPIECVMPAEYPDTWGNYIKEFCFNFGTYTVDSDVDTQTEVPITQGYYPWIALILVIQGLLIYLPHAVWKAFLLTQPLDIKHIVEKANVLRFLNGKEYDNELKKICAYLTSRIQYLRTENIWNSTGFGWKIAVSQILAKVIASMIIMFELFFMNNNFGSVSDIFWGFTMIKEGLTNTRWNPTNIFPRIISCDFNQSMLGGIYPRRTIECVLPHNMMIEKIFIFVWLWLALLLVLSLVDILYTICVLFCPSQRYKTAKYFVLPDLDKDAFDEKSYEKKRMINFAQHMFDQDGIYILRCIKCNAGSLVANDIATKIVEELYFHSTSDALLAVYPNKVNSYELQPSAPPHND